MDNLNALIKDWSYFTYLNPTFSNARLFTVKALIEWRRGWNVIMEVPSNSLDGDDFYKTYFEDIATSTKLTEYS